MNSLARARKRISQPWNLESFSSASNPVVVGKVSLGEVIGLEKRCLDMPIKLAGVSNFEIPEDFSYPGVWSLVHQALAFERMVNPDWRDYYCYLTIDVGVEGRGETLRTPGFHVDGFQGERYSEKLPACHSYLLCSTNPVSIALQEFDFSGLDPAKHNFFLEMDRQVDRDKVWSPNPGEICFVDAYCVHSSTPSPEGGPRVFVRLEFSKKQFDREGNTINPLFGKLWEYEDRQIPKHLI